MHNSKGKKSMVPLLGKLMYGTGGMGSVMISESVMSLILIFGCVALGMPPWLAGLSGGLAMTAAAFLIPLVRYLSDRLPLRLFGKRHFLILVSTILLAVGNCLFWHINLSNAAANFFLMFFVLLAVELLNITLLIPYYALGTELSGDYRERRIIQTIKTVFIISGLIALAFAEGALIGNGFNREKYIDMGFISSTILLLCGALAFLGTFSHLPRLYAKSKLDPEPKATASATYSAFFSVLKERNFRPLAMGYALSVLGLTFILALAFPLFMYCFGFSAFQSGSLFAIALASAAIFLPIMFKLSDKIEKKKILIGGLVLFFCGAATLVVCYILVICGVKFPLMFIISALGAAMCGGGSVAIYSLPGSMTNDLIAVAENKHKTRNARQFNAFSMFAASLSKAAALLISAVALSAYGFRPAAADQSLLTLIGVGVVAFIFPIICLVIAMVSYHKYSLRREEVPEIEEPALETASDTTDKVDGEI